MPCSSGSRMGAFVRGPFSTTTSPERPRMRDGEVVETCGNSGCSPADEALAVEPRLHGRGFSAPTRRLQPEADR